MTGHGEAQGLANAQRIRVSAQSLNSRFLKVMVQTPDMGSEIDSKIEDTVRDRFHRGAVRVQVGAVDRDDQESISFDEKKLRALRDELERVSRELDLPGKVDLELLMAVAGQSGQGSWSQGIAWEHLQGLVTEALDNLDASRRCEGESLKAALEESAEILAGKVDRIEELRGGLAARLRERMHIRLGDLLSGTEFDVDDGAVEREIVMLADRSDITEEIVRVRHHLTFFEETMEAAGPCGRQLEFILQEMHREITTIASKARDGEIARETVLARSELERLREQVRNVE